jgi:hypothetical protein
MRTVFTAQCHTRFAVGNDYWSLLCEKAKPINTVRVGRPYDTVLRSHEVKNTKRRTIRWGIILDMIRNIVMCGCNNFTKTGDDLVNAALGTGGLVPLRCLSTLD